MRNIFFKDGEKVIVNRNGVKPHLGIVKARNMQYTYPVVVNTISYTKNGYLEEDHESPVLLKYTRQNVKLINQLYDIELPLPKSGTELALELLGTKHQVLMAKVSNLSYDDAYKQDITVIQRSGNNIIVSNGDIVKYVIVIDSTTGQPINGFDAINF